MLANRFFLLKKYGYKDIYHKIFRDNCILFIGIFLDNSRFFTSLFFFDFFTLIYIYFAGKTGYIKDQTEKNKLKQDIHGIEIEIRSH